MKHSVSILIFLTIFSCNAQTKKQIKEDGFDVSHGVSLDKIDSAQLKDIRYVHFDSSIGVIFPAEYGKMKFGKTIGWDKRVFFTPDTILVKQIDAAIMNQYCIAMTRFDSAVWRRTIDNLKEDSNENNLKQAQEQMVGKKARFEKLCPQWQHDLIYYDRQYIGFITENGDKMIYIQFLDFRQDPYKLKRAFGISWIGGWHGWFETNTKRMHFHVDKNLLTINEDR